MPIRFVIFYIKLVVAEVGTKPAAALCEYYSHLAYYTKQAFYEDNFELAAEFSTSVI